MDNENGLYDDYLKANSENKDKIRVVKRIFCIAGVLFFVLGFLVGILVYSFRDTRQSVDCTNGYRVIELSDVNTGSVLSVDEYDIKFRDGEPEYREEISYTNLDVDKEYKMTVNTVVDDEIVSSFFTKFVPESSSGKVIVDSHVK